MEKQLRFSKIFAPSQSERIVNVASVPKRSPFRYPGGKTWFVPTFRKWMKARKRTSTLLEPFAGGGIISLTAAFENLAERAVLVELDDNVAAVWTTIIQGDYLKLAKKILEFELSVRTAERALSRRPRSTLDHAFQTILRNRVSHGGIMAPGSGLTKTGEGGKGISSRWYPETLANRIVAIGAIRSKLEFVHGSAFDVIPEYLDDPCAALFIDPPYTAAGKRAGRRLYSNHQLDHDRLFDLVETAAADFLFTYDDSIEVRAKAASHQMEIGFVPMKNTHHAKMQELIIGRGLAWLGQFGSECGSKNVNVSDHAMSKPEAFR